MLALSKETIEKKLLRYPNWQYHDQALHAEFEFDNFKDCFNVMGRIAFECEALNHHPDWKNSYNKLFISIGTHSAKGVTEKDFEWIEVIDAIIKKHQ